MPDYTKQLEEIVRALSRPAIPAWLVAIISSILGFAAAVLLQFVQQWFKRERVRRVLYQDLEDLFSNVEAIMESREIEESQRWAWQRDQLKTHVAFKGEKYLRANEDVYMELSERPVADTVYAYFHDALDGLDSMFHSNWAIARQVFARAVYEDRLKRHCFRKFIGKKRADRLYNRCKAIHEESQRKLEAMGLDGKSP
jgi:hypothetical protein